MDEVKLQKWEKGNKCAINSAIQTSITKEGQDTCVLEADTGGISSSIRGKEDRTDLSIRAKLHS